MHAYERTWPVLNGSAVGTSYAQPKAPVHMVLGNAGDVEGLTRNFARPQPGWSAARSAELGYVRLRFESSGKLVVELVRSEDGTVGDTFAITKGSAPARAAELELQ